MEDGLKAIRIIRDEHRSLGAVIHGLLFLVRSLRERRSRPNFELLEAMLRYIDDFPERFHHPKEDSHLFAHLRLRHPPAAPLLDELEEQHQEGARRMHALHDALARYRTHGEPALAPFADEVEAYASFHWEHMRREEVDALPMCERHLLSEDWAAIDEAFLGHTDPLLGASQQTAFDELFSKIVNLAPPPIGVGPAGG